MWITTITHRHMQHVSFPWVAWLIQKTHNYIHRTSCFIWRVMSHKKKSSHTYSWCSVLQCVVVCIYISLHHNTSAERVVSYGESCHTKKSQVTHIHKLCHTYEWVTHKNDSFHTQISLQNDLTSTLFFCRGIGLFGGHTNWQNNYFFGNKKHTNDQEPLPRDIEDNTHTLSHTHTHTYTHIEDSTAPLDVRECALQCVTLCCSVWQCVAVCCSVLQCVAVCSSWCAWMYTFTYWICPLKSPVYPQKSPVYPQKSPVYLQKSPVYPQQSPVYPQKSPVYPQQSPICPQNARECACNWAYVLIMCDWFVLGCVRMCARSNIFVMCV